MQPARSYSRPFCLLNQSASEMCADECGHLTTWCGLHEDDNEQVVGPLKTKLLFFLIMIFFLIKGIAVTVFSPQ